MQIPIYIRRKLKPFRRAAGGFQAILLTFSLVLVGQTGTVAAEAAPAAKVSGADGTNPSAPKTGQPGKKNFPSLDDVKDSDGKSLNLQASPKKHVFQEVDLSYSYVGDAKLGGKNRGNDGDLGEQSASLGYRNRVPVNDQLSIIQGLNYNRFDFSRPQGSFLPQNLQQFSLSVGAGYALSDKWNLFAMFGPTLSLVDGFDIYSDNISFRGVAGASYAVNKDLLVQFGLAIAPDNGIDIPVIPFGAAQWSFAENWKLNLGLPKTSLDWNIQSNLCWSLLEAQYAGGTYHTNGSYGTKLGAPDLNDRRLNYREVRVGTSATYTPFKGLDLNVAVGAAVYRNFDFDDVGNASPTVDPAPYVQAGAKVSF